LVVLLHRFSLDRPLVTGEYGAPIGREAIKDDGKRNRARLPSVGGAGPWPRKRGGFLPHFHGPSVLARACAVGMLVARTGRPLAAKEPILSFPGICCRSSVVEHSLGKGEVDSSILSGSTS